MGIFQVEKHDDCRTFAGFQGCNLDELPDDRDRGVPFYGLLILVMLRYIHRMYKTKKTSIHTVDGWNPIPNHLGWGCIKPYK